MSIEFRVMSDREIAPNDLLRETKAVLQKLLNLPLVPKAEIKQLSVSPSATGRSEEAVVLGVEGMGEASLSYMDLPGDEARPLVLQRTALVDAGSLRSELSVALAIAMAIAIGKITGATITDDALLLSNSASVAAHSILDSLSLKAPQNDLLQGAHTLFEKLNLHRGPGVTA